MNKKKMTYGESQALAAIAAMFEGRIIVWGGSYHTTRLEVPGAEYRSTGRGYLVRDDGALVTWGSNGSLCEPSRRLRPNVPRLSRKTEGGWYE